MAPPQGGVAAIEHKFLRAKNPKVSQLCMEQTQHQFPAPATTDASVPNKKNEEVLLTNNCWWLVTEADEGPGLNTAASCNVSANGEDHP